MVDAIWGNDFIDTYVGLGDKASIMNKELHLMSMLTLTGQALRNVRVGILNQEIDLRVHSFSIQRSGSGKDGVFNHMNAVGDMAGFEMSKISSLTSAALVGTVEKGGEIRYGVARDSDIVGFKEASTIFNMTGNEHSKDLINYLNMCIDVGGHIRKDLAKGDPIEYYTHISLYGTTFPPSSKNIYIDSGLLPRMLITYKDINSEFYFKVADWVFQNIGNEKSHDIGELKNLGETLKVIHRETTNGFEFNFSRERTTMLGISNTIRNVMSKYPIIIQERAEPFISRMAVYSLKLSCLYAALDNMSTDIKTQHITDANKVISMSLTSILDFITNHDAVNANDVVQNANLVRMAICKLTENNITTFTAVELFKKIYPNIVSLRELNKCLDTLSELGYITSVVALNMDGKPERTVTVLDKIKELEVK